jgi:putative ABC transport system substrate-binding protein
MMDRRRFLLTAMAGALAAPPAVEAQAAMKMPQLGLLSGGPRSPDRLAGLDVFREGLRKRGYVEGQNIAIEYRWAERPEQVQELATELARLKVDVLVAADPASVRAAKRATRTIPIVMVISLDPVGQGYVASLVRPGGNITGLTWDSKFEITGKYLELLKMAVPKITRVAGLIDPTNTGLQPYRKAGEEAAPSLGVTLRHVEWSTPAELERAFDAIASQRAEGLFVYGSALYLTHLPRIVALAGKGRLPAIYVFPEAARLGGLMAYSPSRAEFYRRSAGYVASILKGAKPADLPVEQPTKFELVINLKTAKTFSGSCQTTFS